MTAARPTEEPGSRRPVRGVLVEGESAASGSESDLRRFRIARTLGTDHRRG